MNREQFVEAIAIMEKKLEGWKICIWE
jgi:hypothetical protein